MKKIFSILLSLIFVIIIFPKFEIYKSYSYDDLGNGIWIHINTFNNSNNDEIVSLCKFFIRKEIKNVFILTKDINGELLYKKNEKTLFRMIDIFKKFNIRIHYYIPIAYDPKFLKSYPQEASYRSPDKDNKYPYPDKELKVVNLNSKKYLDYIKTIVKELIYIYHADGIQLDYIRYPNVYFGYDDYVKNEVIKRGGNWEKILDIFRKNQDIFSLYDNNDKDVKILADVRSEVVYNFANGIKDFISSLSKNTIFSVTLIQSGSSFLSYKDGGKDSFPYGFLHFAQDYRKLSEITDFISPLAYHKNYNKDIEWVREIIKNTKRKSVSKILCGIQANDNNENLEKLINICKSEGVNFCIFRLGTFIPALIDVNNIDVRKYELKIFALDKFYESKFNSSFELKINEIGVKRNININEKIDFISEKNIITPFLIGSPLLLDVDKIKLFDIIKFKIGERNYYINGIKKTMDIEPFLFNKRTMVPLRVIAETFKYDVIWEDGKIILRKGDYTINLFINQNRMLINDFEYIIDVAPILKNGRTFLPLRHLSEVLNFLVTWVEKDKEIIIEGYVDENNDRIISY